MQTALMMSLLLWAPAQGRDLPDWTWYVVSGVGGVLVLIYLAIDVDWGHKKQKPPKGPERPKYRNLKE